MKYGLIGEKLGHSYSKIIHEKLADYEYNLFPLDKNEFIEFMEKKDFNGINVTIPYKEMIIPYINHLHPHAKEIGAVNTVINKDGVLYGYNTDYYGFHYMLVHNNIEVTNRKCLILGNGGSTKAVIAVLNSLGAKEILIVSRQKTEGTITYEECYIDQKDAEIIINTTPVGMYPDINSSPLKLKHFLNCEALVDIIYNPTKTKLSLEAKDMNIKGITGLEMLVAQAKSAVEYFLDTKIMDSKIDDIYKEILKNKNGS